MAYICKIDQVCGRIISYKFGSPDAFKDATSPIDTYYVDGVSVTHSSPRQHIWTFAAGFDEQTQYRGGTCPCVTGSTNQNNIPSFVGQNYFCESGLTPWNCRSILFPDGGRQGCGPTSSCCAFNSPPWFNVTLPFPTTDYIEVRICSNIVPDETPIQLMELGVKWTGHVNTANKLEFVASVVECSIVAVFPPNLLLWHVVTYICNKRIHKKMHAGLPCHHTHLNKSRKAYRSDRMW